MSARASNPPPEPADPDASRGGVAWLLYKLWRDFEATDSQLDMVARFCDLYQRYGLINEIGDPLPLYQACRHCESCWHPVPDEAYPDPLKAEIAVPWIGSSYSVDRICALAVNPNKYSPLGGHWWITGGHVRDLLLGKKPFGGFAYGAGSYLAAMTASLRGAPLEDESPSLDTVAQAWHSVAFQESVKCAPEAGRGTATAPMWENCPSTYILDELQLLQPRVLVLIGRSDVAPRVLDLLKATQTEHRDHFERHQAQLLDAPLDVFSLNHPSYGNWEYSYPDLIASLKETPAAHG